MVGKAHYYFDYAEKVFKQSLITIVSIETALSTIGSKFLAEYDDPTFFLELAKQEFSTRLSNGSLLWSQDSESSVRRTSLIIHYPDLGYINLYPKDSFNIELIQKLPRSNSDGDKTNFVNGIYLDDFELIKTSELVVEIVDTDDLDFVWVSGYPNGVFGNNNFENLEEMVFVNP